MARSDAFIGCGPRNENGGFALEQPSTTQIAAVVLRENRGEYREPFAAFVCPEDRLQARERHAFMGAERSPAEVQSSLGMSRARRPLLGSFVGLLGRIRELFPLTNLGLGVLLAAAAAYYGFGVPRTDYVVQLVSVLAAALVAGALIVVLAGAVLTHRAVRRYLRGEGGAGSASDRDGPIMFEARRGWGTGLRLPRRAWFPLLEVSWTWEAPQEFRVIMSRVDGEIWENIETHRRAHEERIVRRFVVEDSFGLARIVLRRTEDRTLRVVPYSGNLDRAPILRSLAAGEDLSHPSGVPMGDRVDMRRYVPGDPLRLALWKVFARTRQLMVRTPERAIEPAVRVVAYLVSAVGDEPAAAAARVAVDGGHLGNDWLFGADGAERPTNDREAAVDLIVRSRNVRDTRAANAFGLERFVQVASETEPVRLILFLPSVPGPWLDRVAATLRSHRGSASAVIVTDGVRAPEEARPSKLDRVLRIPEPPRVEDEAYTTPNDLMSIARALAAAGAEVTAIDREHGRALGLGVRGSSERAYAMALGRAVA
jgi:hypothetical protein